MSPDDPGISAVLSSHVQTPLTEEALLDLAAVLDGLVGETFEIIVADGPSDMLDSLLVRFPNLPLRILESPDHDPAAGIATATYDLILHVSADGTFDVRELNHFLEAVEHGAELAIGYRAHTVKRFAWYVLGYLLFGRTARDVDCPFKLFRRAVWQRTGMAPRGVDRWFSTRLIVRARRLGFRVAELPVKQVQRARDRSTTDAAETRSPAVERVA
jgi:hypothetical protein